MFVYLGDGSLCVPMCRSKFVCLSYGAEHMPLCEAYGLYRSSICTTLGDDMTAGYTIDVRICKVSRVYLTLPIRRDTGLEVLYRINS